MLPLAKLAKHCGLSITTTRRALLNLQKQGYIVYRPGRNQFHPTIYEISTEGRANLPPRTSAVPKTAMPVPSDSDVSLEDLSIGDRNDNGEVIHTKHDHGIPDQAERLACLVADGLEDMKNLALYKNYCARFPTQMILKAYIKAKEVSPDKIKKSRGALFNFLIQRYAKKQTPNNDSGHQTG